MNSWTGGGHDRETPVRVSACFMVRTSPRCAPCIQINVTLPKSQDFPSNDAINSWYQVPLDAAREYGVGWLWWAEERVQYTQDTHVRVTRNYSEVYHKYTAEVSSQRTVCAFILVAKKEKQGPELCARVGARTK